MAPIADASAHRTNTREWGKQEAIKTLAANRVSRGWTPNDYSTSTRLSCLLTRASPFVSPDIACTERVRPLASRPLSLSSLHPTT